MCRSRYPSLFFDVKHGPAGLDGKGRSQTHGQGVERMNRLTVAAIFSGALTLFAGPPAIGASQTLTLADLRHEVGISDPRFGPDGHTVVFVESRPDFTSNRTDTDLVSIDTRTAVMHPLTNDRTGVSSPRWSPDGSRLAFLADDNDADGGTTQLFVMSSAGGNVRQVTHAGEGIDSFAWRPDGGAFAYVTADKTPHAISFDVGDNDYLATSAPQPWHLWIVDAGGGGARRLTHGPKGLPPGEVILPQAVPESWFSWSKDGRSI